MPRIHVLHENADWLPPLRAALEARGLPWVEWHLDRGLVDLSAAPPDGVFYNRMSASSHSRGHRFAPELTAQVLAWLEAHGRRVVNGGRALDLEISKVRQYTALREHAIPVPPTAAAVGREAVIEAASRIPGPWILKHNRAGKGLGVALFREREALAAHVLGDAFEDSVDGVTLVQSYIEAPERAIVRHEFIGGRFLYAVRVDTTGGFELCPAEACAVDAAARPMFEILEGYDHPLVRRYEAFLAANGIEVAGIEHIVDARGRAWAYDVNTNTNYNPEAEARAGISAMGGLADFLGRQLGQRHAA
jgi:hypothetical protein